MRYAVPTLMALLLQMVASGFGGATLIERYLRLDECVQAAGYVFAGTVKEMQVEKPGPRSSYVTHVVFERLAFGKGRWSKGELILTLRGGRIKDTLDMVIGQPTFEVGKRYIVMANESLAPTSRAAFPIIGLFQGLYLVRPDGSGRPIVHDGNGHPVTGVSHGRLMIVDSLAAHESTPDSLGGADVPFDLERLEQTTDPILVVPRRHDSGHRVTEPEFLELIRKMTASR